MFSNIIDATKQPFDSWTMVDYSPFVPCWAKSQANFLINYSKDLAQNFFVWEGSNTKLFVWERSNTKLFVWERSNTNNFVWERSNTKLFVCVVLIKKSGLYYQYVSLCIITKGQCFFLLNYFEEIMKKWNLQRKLFYIYIRLLPFSYLGNSDWIIHNWDPNLK